MSNEKLAETLRSLRLKFTSGNDVPVPEARITRAEWEALERAHAAEAAQPQAQNSEWVMVPREPTQAMLDANGDSDSPEGKAWLEQDARDTWAAMLAAAPQLQAGEPVWQFRAFHTTGKWIDVKDREVWAVVTAHSDAYETRTLYTRPQQPAQDAKDARTPDFIDVSFEVWQSDEMVASCSGPEPQALTEAKYYASQYAQDGPVSVFRVSRVRIDTAKESGAMSDLDTLRPEVREAMS